MFFGSLFSAYVMLRAGSLELARAALACSRGSRPRYCVGASATFGEERIRLIGSHSLGLTFVVIRLLSDALMIGKGLLPSASLQLACWFTLGAVHTAFVFGAAVVLRLAAGPVIRHQG